MASGRTIKVSALARVEGEGGLTIRLANGNVEKVELSIYEPPRLFEALLRGRRFSEAPDITARICGICPVAYQMSSVHAMEAAAGASITEPIRQLRRLLYCGEWIESHVLHVAMLHAPDFLGYESGLHMAKDHPAIVERSLKLKKIGNEIVTAVGGREIHPVNVRVGGFYRAPAGKELGTLLPKLEWAAEAAAATLTWVSRFQFPDFEQDYDFVSLRHPTDYPFSEGRIVSSSGLDIPFAEYEKHFVEEQVPHSNALHSRKIQGGGYHVGPLARYSLNFDRLPGDIQAAARAAGLGPIERNPFKSIVVRSVETLYAVREAQRIIAAYLPPDPSFVEVVPRGASGAWATEAPRGLLYHRYRIAETGLIEEARIVPPTSQNQGTIENDLRNYVTPRMHLPEAELTWQCEQAVRNYDPCISCATHFLKLTVLRT
jgi:coenzyme F420-reducing hydrogenase alpha subunit